MVECRPDDDEVELVESFDGGVCVDRGVFVNCGVAEVANEVELLVDDMARDGFELGVVDACAEVISVRGGDVENGVEVCDELFDAAASINAGSAWIGEDVRFGSGTIREHRGPLGPDEPEVRHLSSCASLPREFTCAHNLYCQVKPPLAVLDAEIVYSDFRLREERTSPDSAPVVVHSG